MAKVLILGATSAIAEATARQFARNGDQLFLAARNKVKVEALAEDLRLRGASRVTTAHFDVRDGDSPHEALIEKACETLGGLEIALIVHGVLPEQKECEHSFQLTREQFEINALSVLSLLTHLANRFEKQRHGTLAVVSSVAGDRGRQSNYVYGAAKAAVDVFMEGLRHRLYGSGVRVLTIKPGLVDTPMTARMQKNFLWTSPEVVAAGIYRAIHRHKDVVYLPWFWAPIMWLVRSLPEALFKRTRL